MKQPPCRNCERRGCGSYHDECPKFKAYRDNIAVCKEVRNQMCEITGTLIKNKVRAAHNDPISFKKFRGGK